MDWILWILSLDSLKLGLERKLELEASRVASEREERRPHSLHYQWIIQLPNLFFVLFTHRVAYLFYLPEEGS